MLEVLAIADGNLDYAADVPLILFFKGKAFDFVLIYNMFYLLWAY